MINRDDIRAAAERIVPHVRHTPILRLAAGDLGLPCEVVLKLEHLQHAGSFKPRGAFNRVLTAEVPAAGLIAASGGNHGAAVAYVAQARGVAAEIFVPAATPAAKCTRIESFGARLTRVGDGYGETLAACRARAQETGALELHAFDHPDIIAGQGTVGYELQQDAPELTHVLVAVGGGGLIGGIAAWYAGSAQVISAEPEACPSLFTALAIGMPIDAPAGGVAADSLGAPRVGEETFPLARAHVARSVLLTDAAITAAQRLLWDRLRLLVEPGGATALAALTSGAWTPPTGARVGVILCGANVASPFPD